MINIRVSRNCAIHPLSEWPPPKTSEAWTRVEKHCEVLLRSFAFQRLRNITFLGILAPRFKAIPGHPIFASSHIRKTDGTRADHSVGVSYLFSELIRSVELNQEAEMYAMAWGLVHDIATWPLSHTSEPAFAAITGVSSHDLRRMIILGDARLPSHFGVSRELKEMGVKPELLAQLFDKGVSASAGHFSQNQSLALIRDIARSPITPDSIEGMFRSGRVLGVPVPEPCKFSHILADGRLFASFSGKKAYNRNNLVRFWEAKARIYSEYINSPRSICWESAWSKTIQRIYSNINLVESLKLTEDDIVSEVLREGVEETTSQFRYKQPLRYLVDRSQTNLLNKSPLIKDLNRILIKEKA